MRRPRTTPPCLNATVDPPCRPSGVRPPSAASVSGPRVSARPQPIRICGANVHTTSESGRMASPARPPPTRITPDSAIPLSANREAADAMIAAAGMTETAAAAAIGSMPQPSTSIRTSRKSAAVSAAETSASARFGARRSRVVEGRGTTGTRHAEITGARTARAIGTWTANTARHESACVSTPPIAGPTAAPTAAAPTHTLTPRSCDLATAGSSSSAAQTTAAPLTAWTQRAAITVSRLPATAAAAEAAANTTRPAASIRTGPNRRATIAAGTAASATARLNAVMTHEMPVTVASSAVSMSGSASTTTDASASTIPTATASPISAHTGRRGSITTAGTTSIAIGGRRLGRPQAVPGPAGRLPEQRDERRDEERADDERLDQDAYGHDECELPERAHVNDGKKREAERKRDAGGADRARRLRRGLRQGLAHREATGLLPHPARDEDVVVRSERHEQHGRRERDVVGELAVAQERLEDPDRDPHRRGDAEHAREHEQDGRNQRAQVEREQGRVDHE